MQIITSNKNNISFNVQVTRLHEAITKADIGLGTSSYPIVINNFVTINDPNLYSFYPGETISITLIDDIINPEDSRLDLELVSCRLLNIGQEFNNSKSTLANPWSGVFNLDTNKIVIAPDGSLSITPENNACSITVSEDPNESSKTTFVSYSILLKSKVSLSTNTVKVFYFLIDPLIKVTSGGRG